MKNLIYLILPLLSLMACGQTSEAEQQAKVVPDNIASETTSIIKNAKTISAKVEEARGLTPMTPAEYEAWFPETILLLPRMESGPNDHSEIPTQGAYLRYGNDSKKNIELRIMDMTGELANTMIAFDMTIGKKRNDRDWGSHYTKAVERAGYVANETHDKNKLYTFLRFIHADRYLVSIKANGFTPDELWENITEFQLNKLK